ncbi:hypothetical protein GE09DRAFT_1151206 [Coniochaeta sp. 2T2.1]|nr:hypothetical protein GE09DRAFT_1151206 [Coniochaeta sp. 2T2.1]
MDGDNPGVPRFRFEPEQCANCYRVPNPNHGFDTRKHKRCDDCGHWVTSEQGGGVGQNLDPSMSLEQKRKDGGPSRSPTDGNQRDNVTTEVQHTATAAPTRHILAVILKLHSNHPSSATEGGPYRMIVENQEGRGHFLCDEYYMFGPPDSRQLGGCCGAVALAYLAEGPLAGRFGAGIYCSLSACTVFIETHDRQLLQFQNPDNYHGGGHPGDDLFGPKPPSPPPLHLVAFHHSSHQRITRDAVERALTAADLTIKALAEYQTVRNVTSATALQRNRRVLRVAWEVVAAARRAFRATAHPSGRPIIFRPAVNDVPQPPAGENTNAEVVLPNQTAEQGVPVQGPFAQQAVKEKGQKEEECDQVGEALRDILILTLCLRSSSNAALKQAVALNRSAETVAIFRIAHAEAAKAFADVVSSLCAARLRAGVPATHILDEELCRHDEELRIMEEEVLSNAANHYPQVDGSLSCIHCRANLVQALGPCQRHRHSSHGLFNRRLEDSSSQQSEVGHTACEARKDAAQTRHAAREETPTTGERMTRPAEGAGSLAMALRQILDETRVAHQQRLGGMLFGRQKLVEAGGACVEGVTGEVAQEVAAEEAGAEEGPGEVAADGITDGTVADEIAADEITAEEITAEECAEGTVSDEVAAGEKATSSESVTAGATLEEVIPEEASAEVTATDLVAERLAEDAMVDEDASSYPDSLGEEDYFEEWELSSEDGDYALESCGSSEFASDFDDDSDDEDNAVDESHHDDTDAHNSRDGSYDDCAGEPDLGPQIAGEVVLTRLETPEQAPGAWDLCVYLKDEILPVKDWDVPPDCSHDLAEVARGGLRGTHTCVGNLPADVADERAFARAHKDCPGRKPKASKEYVEKHRSKQWWDAMFQCEECALVLFDEEHNLKCAWPALPHESPRGEKGA